MKSLLPGARVISFSLSCYFDGFVIDFDDVYAVGQLIQRDDGLVSGEDRGEAYSLSVESEGAHLVVGSIHDEAVTFEGKLTVGFNLLDARSGTVGEGRNLPQFVTGGSGSGSHGHLVISEGYFRLSAQCKLYLATIVE